MAGNFGEKNVWWIARYLADFTLAISLTRQLFSYIWCRLAVNILMECSHNSQSTKIYSPPKL